MTLVTVSRAADCSEIVLQGDGGEPEVKNIASENADGWVARASSNQRAGVLQQQVSNCKSVAQNPAHSSSSNPAI